MMESLQKSRGLTSRMAFSKSRGNEVREREHLWDLRNIDMGGGEKGSGEGNGGKIGRELRLCCSVRSVLAR